MGTRPKHKIAAAAATASLTPPDSLTPTQSMARMVSSEGKGLYTCVLPGDSKSQVLVRMAARFRGAVFLRRGGYVLVDLVPEGEREPGVKVVGDIVNVVGDEKEWRRQSYWPAEFARPVDNYGEESEEDEEESTMGKMPPSDSEEDN